MPGTPVTPDDRYVWRQFLPCTEEERRGEITVCTAPDLFGGVTQIHETGEDVLFCLADADAGVACDPLGSPGVMRHASVIYEDARRWLEL